MFQAIAVIGIACRYPDARGPEELWENVLSQRRSFRRIPPERLLLEDYFSEDRKAPDSTYSSEAALIDGFEFDRAAFRVGVRTFRSTDVTHWLALDVASQALEDAGHPGGRDLPRDEVGVLVGNSLTGEFSRASLLRLRWPYVRRQVAASLIEEGWGFDRTRAFLARLEAHYKEPFPETTEDSLAGGLSNTIAGRICNHFDLNGGGYSVDGACSSSLLAVSNACSALASGDLEMALVGGVDLSLDPFELVGFAKTRALAAGEMRVYDRRSSGFVPGEGCGFVVLERFEEAVARGRRIYAVIRGWGISSDGRGGLTRPEAQGQLHAVRRAYRRAGFGIDSLALVEGHGTGTAVGDATELGMLNRARREAGWRTGTPAAIGSIKANIGHTKAAAGVASLIKATMAVHRQILPPTTGCVEAHAALTGEGRTLRVVRRPEIWPSELPLRAGVSAMGFGGINAHVALEGVAPKRRRNFAPAEHPLLAGRQDAEILCLSAAGWDELRGRVQELEARAKRLSRAELSDLGAELACRLPSEEGWRAAVVASTPRELKQRLATLRDWLREEERSARTRPARLEPRLGVFLGSVAATPPRLGFLFPGQASPAHLEGGLWRWRFDGVDELYRDEDARRRAAQANPRKTLDTSVAQPAIATASLAALRVLASLGVEARVALGHSLGELVALHWAGAYGAEALLRIAVARGRAMSEAGDPSGAMASLNVDASGARELLTGLDPQSVAITGYNSPAQTVVSGTERAVDEVVRRARDRDLRARRLPVSHAFHSPLVAGAAARLEEALRDEEILSPQGRVSSTITGGWLGGAEDLRELLCRQVSSPVHFISALEAAASEADVFLEVGPGNVLSGLARQIVSSPVLALDAGGESLRSLLQAVGSLFALGARVDPGALFADRFTRPLREPRFLVNPCELAPRFGRAGSEGGAPQGGAPERADAERGVAEPAGSEPRPPTARAFRASSPLQTVRELLAERTELPLSAISEESRLLSDLHLNSIAVAELVADASRRLGLPPPAAPTEYADVSVETVGRSLEELLRTGAKARDNPEKLPAGVDTWFRPFTVELTERPLPHSRALQPRPGEPGSPAWRVLAPEGDALGLALREAFSPLDAGEDPAGGLVVYLPPDVDERHLDLMLEAGRTHGKDRSGPLILVHHGGAAAFFRTFYQERPELSMTVVEIPEAVAGRRMAEPDKAVWCDWVIAEAAVAHGYSEACYDLSGRRFQPVLRWLPAAPGNGNPAGELAGLEPGDVVLVTGGGKGIGAECALALAQRGVHLALWGRSRPEDDRELAANLERFAALGATFLYLRADVRDRESVRRAVEKTVAELGPVHGILHSAGTNVPRLISTLRRADIESTLAPKVGGLKNLLSAVDPSELKLVVGFGSIIARTGMPGEADYALANEWLRLRLEAFSARCRACRCLCIEWSVWSGVGMGARLSRLETLARQGISAMPPEEGVRRLLELLARPTPLSVVVTGRFGNPPTLEIEQPELPLLRFLERPRVHVPGVELVVDCSISSDTDPYLEDHVFGGERLFPAVMGLEAMAQCRRALIGSAGDLDSPPAFGQIRFERPISVPAKEPVILRLAALVRGPDEVEVVLRSGRTGFQVDHFRAVLRRPEPLDERPEPLLRSMAESWRRPDEDSAEGWLPLDPLDDLYGTVLFQEGRFRRLRGYKHLRATECWAEIAHRDVSWFSPYQPADLELFDPGMRDACIHGIQACIPHAVVLPVGVERLLPGSAAREGPWSMAAAEREREGRTLVYDIEVRNQEGDLVERWEQLELRVVAPSREPPALAPPLLGPYLERRLGDDLPEASLAVVVALSDKSIAADLHTRRSWSDRALRQILGADSAVHRRPDGRPEAAGEARRISIAHRHHLTLAVVGHGAVGCDLETVGHRSAAAWLELLGAERRGLLEVASAESGEDLDWTATRVWTALESLKKAGRPRDAPLVFSSAAPDGWVFFSSGALTAATVILPPDASKPRIAVAILAPRSPRAPGAPEIHISTPEEQIR